MKNLSAWLLLIAALTIGTAAAYAEQTPPVTKVEVTALPTLTMADPWVCAQVSYSERHQVSDLVIPVNDENKAVECNKQHPDVSEYLGRFVPLAENQTLPFASNFPVWRRGAWACTLDQHIRIVRHLGTNVWLNTSELRFMRNPQPRTHWFAEDWAGNEVTFSFYEGQECPPRPGATQ